MPKQMFIAILSVILFVLGLWPIALIPVILLVVEGVKKAPDNQAEKEMDEIRKNIEEYRKGR